MGIEESLERITNALETIAVVQTQLLTIAEWNKARLEKTADVIDKEVANIAAEEAPDPAAEAPTAPASEAETRQPQQWTYDALKAELRKRGVEVAKGTKMTTLLKFWELHKNDPEMQVVDPPDQPANGAPAAPAAPAAQAPAASAPRNTEADVRLRPMTELEARKAIMDRGYTGTPEQIAMMKKALAEVGKAKFAELGEGDYEKLLAELDRLMQEKA